MGEATRRKQLDPTWGKLKEIIPGKRYPCVAIISFLINEDNDPEALDLYIHEDENKENAWKTLKKKNPKGYEYSLKLHRPDAPLVVKIKTNSEREHLLKVIDSFPFPSHWPNRIRFT